MLFARRKNRLLRQQFHADSPARRRAQRLSQAELAQWAEAVSMNMNYWVSHYLNKPDGVCLEEALQHNDILCAVLLEMQARHRLMEVVG